MYAIVHGTYASVNTEHVLRIAHLRLYNHWVGEFKLRNGHCMRDLALQEQSIARDFNLDNHLAQSLHTFYSDVSGKNSHAQTRK